MSIDGSGNGLDDLKQLTARAIGEVEVLKDRVKALESAPRKSEPWLRAHKLTLAGITVGAITASVLIFRLVLSDGLADTKIQLNRQMDEIGRRVETLELAKSAAIPSPLVSASAAAPSQAKPVHVQTGVFDCKQPPRFQAKSCITQGGASVEPNILLGVTPLDSQYESMKQAELERILRALRVDPFQKWTDHLHWMSVSAVDRNELLMRQVNPNQKLDICDWLLACAGESKLDPRFVRCEMRFFPNPSQGCVVSAGPAAAKK